MNEWMKNGCRLAFLIDVEKKNVFIYRQNRTTDVINSFDKKILGEELWPGFEPDLSELK